MTKIIAYWILIYQLQLVWAQQLNEEEAQATADFSVPELIIKNGYPVETYSNVTTEDGYLLDVYRIPYGRTDTTNMTRPAVLLMHGLMGSSRDFIIMGPERGLGYLLADRDYDVWLGNNRGTIYSRKHQVLNPDTDKKYWQFSWHEMGVYDLPAIFKLMNEKTNHERFSYIGNSQGSTIFYVLASERPQYNHNITIMVSIPPVAYMGNTYSPILRILAGYERDLSRVAKRMGVYEVAPKVMNNLLVAMNRQFCKDGSGYLEVCANVFFMTGGYDYDQLNKSALYTIYSKGIAGASIRQLFHYSQSIRSGHFKQYDLGKKENLRKYKSVEPPHYDLNKIVAPVALFYSEGDWLVDTKDVDRLDRELSNSVYKYKIPYKQFNHYDFMFATDVVALLYQNIFDLLDNYN